MLKIHLFGTLRKLSHVSSATEDSYVMVDFRENETVHELLMRLGLQSNDIGDVFINHKVVNLTTIIPSEDSRVSIFSRGMVLLCGGQHLKGHGFITKKPPVNVSYFNT